MSVRRGILVVLAVTLFAVAVSAQIPGESWVRIGLLAGDITALGISPSYDASSPDHTLYAGVRGSGLWRSTNGGLVWRHVAGVPDDATVTAIAFHPTYKMETGAPMWAGTRQGHVYTSYTDFNDHVYDYITVSQSSGLVVPVTSLAVPAAGTYQYNVFAGTSGGGIFRSTNSGQAFSVTAGATPDCRALAAGPTGQVLAACYSSPNGPIYAWSGEWVYRGPSTLAGVEPTALHIASSDAAKAWLGTKDHGLWLSADSGNTWGAACDGVVGATVSFSVGAVAACPRFSSDGEVWEGRSDGLFISTNGAVDCSLDGLYGSVTAVAFAPRYHITSSCDAFVGTQSGLFLKSCTRPQVPVTPPAVSVSSLALPANAIKGSWAGTNLGLLWDKTYDNNPDYSTRPYFVQYNASGSPLGSLPDIAAICLTPVYNVAGTCNTDAATVIVAERTKGVFKSTDHGNSWSKLDLNGQGVSTWPPAAVVNDLAISPKYATGSSDETLFAATSVGLRRWDGPTTGWTLIATDWVYNYTKVALPPTYDRAMGTNWPYQTLYIATDNATHYGLYFSLNNGLTISPFTDTDVKQNDITAIAFSPGYGVSGGDSLAFVSRMASGVFFSADNPSGTSLVYWCPFNTGLASLNVRALAASPAFYNTNNVRLLEVTSDPTGPGPYYCNFLKTNLSSSSCSGLTYTWTASGFSPASTPPFSGCMDTLCATFAYWGPGEIAAVGTAEDGVFFSMDGGKSFLSTREGIGYYSLPDDVAQIVPYPRDPKVIFAASPSYGVFASTDKGASFSPWNNAAFSADCTIDGAAGLGVMIDRWWGATPPAEDYDAVWAGEPSTTTTSNQGIKMRWIHWTGTAVDLNYLPWWDTSGAPAGPFEKIETLGSGQTAPAWATSSVYGFYKNNEHTAQVWTNENGALPATTSTAVRYGYPSSDPVPISSGATVAGALGQGQWNYYSLVVTPGTSDLQTVMNDLSSASNDDPDLYVRYAALPDLSNWDYRPYLSVDEEVCVQQKMLLSEGFSSGIPAAWTVVDGGSGGGAAATWTTANPGSRTIGSPFSAPFAIVDSDNAGSGNTQDEQLITPSMNARIWANVTLSFSNQYRGFSTGTATVDVSPDGGSTWTTVLTMTTANDGYPTPNTKTIDISSIAAGQTNFKVRFHYVNTTGYAWWWAVDNVTITASAPRPGTWYIGINGYGSGTNPYELTVTLNSGCTSFAALPAGANKAPYDEKAMIANSLPGPLAPSAGTLWGTINAAGGGGGVWKGSDPSTIIATKAPSPSAGTITWEQRNGTGAGALSNLNTQCVQQLPDLTLIAGCLGNVFYSPKPDQGLTTWVDSTSHLASAGSNDFRDLLLCSNGDLLIAANGTGTGTSAGGVWLSGDKGRNWMRISEGFDASSQLLEDLANDNPITGNVQYYTSTDGTGLYTRTITAQAYPTVTALSPNAGTTLGGETITVTGTGFSNGCPTGDSLDCRATGPVVLFGDTEAATTYVNGTTLTCTVPSHAAGVALVTVRNPDTRQGGTRAYTYACVAPSSLTNNTAADLDPYADTGVLVTWQQDAGNWGDGGGGSETYDVLRNSVAIQSGLPYGTTSFTDTTGTNGVTYTYQVRYNNGCGSSQTSGGVAASDQFLAPLEVPNTSLVWTGGGKNALSWSSATGATAYRVYRGAPSELKNLPTGASVCSSYDGAATTTGATLTTNPASGSFFWYLVVGYNGAGEGSAGPGCIISSTGLCATP